MTRFFLISLFSLLSFDAYAMGLRQNNILNTNTITLGDIFYDLPRDEGRVLGTAPLPGKEITLNARTLYKIARNLDLPWRPSSGAEQITLKRAATVIEYNQIKEAIHTALYDEGMLGQYEINIPLEYHKLILPADQPATVSVTQLDIDPTTHAFNVVLAAPSAGNPIQQVHVKGRMDSMISVPVLLENVQHGRVITELDIKMIQIKERAFNKNMIVDPYALVGMTAKRVLVADRPLRSNEIIAPQIIERGEYVILSLKTGIMNLTTQVKAMQSGAKGDIIRVMNMESNQSVQARITGTRAVETVQN